MGAMTFEEWSSYKTMVMGETPAWFNDPNERRRRFEAYRTASEDNCCVVSAPVVGFTPVARRPIDVAPIAVPMVAQTGPAISYRAMVRAAALALLVQIMLFAAPAFASGTVLVNGNALAGADRVSLEAVVGPLDPGRYWVDDNGEFGREGADIPIANLRLLIQQRMRAAQTEWQAQQQYALRQQLKLAALLLMRQRQTAQSGYATGNIFSSGERYSDGSWTYYSGHSSYGVGGTANGCVYTPTWSNC
jgi:hypothetical protein